MMQSLPAMTIV